MPIDNALHRRLYIVGVNELQLIVREDDELGQRGRQERACEIQDTSANATIKFIPEALDLPLRNTRGVRDPVVGTPSDACCCYVSDEVSNAVCVRIDRLLIAKTLLSEAMHTWPDI